MKKLMWIGLGFVAATAFIACGVKDKNGIAAKYAANKANQQDPNKKPTDPNNKDNTAAGTCAPTQGGQISVGGSELVTTNADKAKAVDTTKVTTTQTSGKKADADKPTILSNQAATATDPSAPTLKTLEQQASAKTYASLGCTKENLPTDIAKNWTQVQVAAGTEAGADKATANINVNSIYVCGQATIPASLQRVTFIAEQMIFATDSSLKMDKVPLSSLLSIYVNKLTVRGNNTITVVNADAADLKADSQAASVGLQVLKTLDAGSVDKLTLSTVGGSCSKAAIEPTKASPPSRAAKPVPTVDPADLTS